MTDKKFNDPVDVNKLFSKCMTETHLEIRFFAIFT